MTPNQKPNPYFLMVSLPILAGSVVFLLIALRGGAIPSPASLMMRLGGIEEVTFDICSPGDMFGNPMICKSKAERDGHKDCKVIKAEAGGGGGCHSTLRCILKCNVRNLVSEDTEARCADGADNDGDGLIDLHDYAGCKQFVPPPTTENAWELCRDRKDNDGDALIDRADPDCGFMKERNSATCRDNVDNYADGIFDAANPDCAAFYPAQAPPPPPPEPAPAPTSTASSTGV